MSLTKLNFPPGISGFQDSVGNNYAPDQNGQITINPDLVNVSDFLNAAFTYAVDVDANTGSRPTNGTPGDMYFDSTLGKPVWLKTAPSSWVDATGTAA